MRKESLPPVSVVVVTEYFKPSTSATAQLVADLVKYLTTNGTRVTVLTSTPYPGFKQSDQLRRVTLTIPFIGQANVSKSLRGIYFTLLSIYWSLFHLKSGSKVIIFSNPPFIGFLGIALTLFKKIAYVYVMQDLFPRSATIAGILPHKGPVHSLWTHYSKAVCTFSHSVVVLSNSMKTRLQKDLGTNFPVHVIYNWSVIKPYFQPKSENSISINSNILSSLTLQYSGNFGTLHEFITFLETARLLVNYDIKFVFVGAGAKLPQIEAYKKNFSLSNVLIQPLQPLDKLPQSLAACDIACISTFPGSEDTVAPSKLYGCLASGKPIFLVASNSSELGRIITANQLGIHVEPGDVSGLASEILAIYRNPKSLLAMSRNCIKYYDAHYGLEKSAPRYVEQLLDP